MLKNKVTVEEFPMGGDANAERRLFSAKGEMAQILNRPKETFSHLVYWDLDSERSGQDRGHHYHVRETEHFYILTGELELFLEDLETSERQTLVVKAGSRITIEPNVAHSVRSRVYSQVLEYSPEPYDPSDTHPHKLVV